MKKITIIFMALLAFCWQSIAQDDCASAVAVTPGSITGTVITTETGSGEMGGGADSAWFVYTATTDGTINVNSCFGGADTDLSIGTGTCGALINTINNDDSCDLGGGDEYASEIDGYAVVAGTDYYIEWSNEWSVGPFNWSLTFTPAPSCTSAEIDTLQTIEDCDNTQYSIYVPFISQGDAVEVSDGTTSYPIIDGGALVGPYASGEDVNLTVVHIDVACNIVFGTLSFTCPENQDTCATADAVTEGTYTTTINTGTGGAEMGTGNDSAFFAYTPTQDGSIYVNSCDGGADTYLNIGSGTCGDLFVEGSNDDSCASGLGNNYASELTISVTAGTTYYIEWDNRYTSGANEFDWTLEFIAPPACIPAIIDSADVIETCDPDGTGTFTVDIVVSDAGDAGSVFDDGTNTYPVIAGTVSAGPYDSGESVTIELVSLDEDCGSTVGTFTFTCPLPAPDNDLCVNAVPVVCGDTLSGTNVLATDGDEVAGDGCGTSSTAVGVWYVYAGTGDTVTASTCAQADFDTEITVYTGVCGDFTCLDNNDDNSAAGCTSNTSLLEFETVIGTDYFIYVSGFGAATGAFDLSITCVAPPTCTAAVIDSSTIVDACEPDGTGTFTVEHFVSNAGDEGTLFSDGVATYPVVDGTVVTGPYNSGETVTIDVVALDSDCTYSLGDFEFTCPEPAPENDDIAEAINIPVGDSVCEATVLGTNEGATDSIENINTADCTFAEGIPLGDVWFKVIVPSTGELIIETSDSGGISDTVMTVYLGTSGNLTQVGCSDDDGDAAFSKVELTGDDGIAPGDVLLVRVWEYGDNLKGTFNICAWSPSTLGIVNNTFNGFTYYPNPVKDGLTLESPNTIDSIEVFNILGQRIVAIDSGNTIQNIDMSEVQAGAYFVKVSIGNQIKTLRIIKE
ncbi:T9SS type A sorting domain-containing protein [Psychroserpens damuponensis]|uniref:T9SS type A sorting domain-containing protein n=1 Tax=Psychroserpens damuponensis TaxID=943936 RepID=UPI00058B7883|nr:T9SS type A sorting domain-containing protein [Psychroserpens damuponensis]